MVSNPVKSCKPFIEEADARSRLPLCPTGDVPFPFPVPARRKGAHVPGNAGFADCARSCCGLSKNGSHLQNQSMTASRLRCAATRSEEHTSELQSLMRISYAVFCLTKKTTPKDITP